MLFVGLDPGDSQIVVAAQIDVVVGRILVVVDAFEILVAQIGVVGDLDLLLDLLIRNRLLRLEHRFGLPRVTALDAGYGIVLAQIVEAGAAFRAAMLGTPFWLDHENPRRLASGRKTRSKGTLMGAVTCGFNPRSIRRRALP